MCDLDLESCTVWREEPKVVMKPRKPRHCACCGASIGPGEWFIDHFDLFEGGATTEAGCFACWWTREVFAEAHGNRVNFGWLWQALLDCIGENDDPLDVWRPHLAAVKKRWRVSAPGRRALARNWAS